MKTNRRTTTLAAAIVACVLLAARAVRADAWDDILHGGLIGGAVGALVAGTSDDIRAEHAVPAFAAVGALLGYGHDRGWFESRHDRWRHYPWYVHPYAYGHPEPWAYQGGAPWWYEYPVRPAQPAQPATETQSPAAARETGSRSLLQPGVELVTVPVTMKNGNTLPLRLIRLGSSRYVGPQGEEYESLPDPAKLAERYGG